MRPDHKLDEEAAATEAQRQAEQFTAEQHDRLAQRATYTKNGARRIMPGAVFIAGDQAKYTSAQE